MFDGMVSVISEFERVRPADPSQHAAPVVVRTSKFSWSPSASVKARTTVVDVHFGNLQIRVQALYASNARKRERAFNQYIRTESVGVINLPIPVAHRVGCIQTLAPGNRCLLKRIAVVGHIQA